MSKNGGFILAGLTVSAILAFFLSPFASSRPDGLEWVAGVKGFLHLGEGAPAFRAAIPDYAFPGVSSEALATGLAGIIGVLLVFALGWGLGSLLKRRQGDR